MPEGWKYYLKQGSSYVRNITDKGKVKFTVHKKRAMTSHDLRWILRRQKENGLENSTELVQEWEDE